jgi:hypothetical protein
MKHKSEGEVLFPFQRRWEQIEHTGSIENIAELASTAIVNYGFKETDTLGDGLWEELNDGASMFLKTYENSLLFCKNVGTVAGYFRESWRPNSVGEGTERDYVLLWFGIPVLYPTLVWGTYLYNLA